jgi:arylsulfatase A-like enzyme
MEGRVNWKAGCLIVTVLSVSATACSRSGPDSDTLPAIRLVDNFEAKVVQGAAAANVPLPRTEWRFDGAPAGAPPPRFAETRGWEAGPGVSDLAIRDGLLVGRTTSDTPLIHLERPSGFDVPDNLHAVEIRMRVSDGANLAMQASAAPNLVLANVVDAARSGTWPLQSPIQSGGEMQTYVVTPLAPIPLSRSRHLMVRPTDVAGATFAIESIRLISRREHLASIPAGVGWHGLAEIYRESLVAHAPETLTFDLQLPERPWLDLAVGTAEDGPVTFVVNAKRQGATDDRDAVQVSYTVTRPNRWERYPIDLSALAGRAITLSLQLQSETPNALGFWGSPVVRSLGAPPKTDGRRARAGDGSAPRGVILIQADTLRRDHLNFYGHSRETAPLLTRAAKEGVVFNHAISNASWTKVSSPSILTGLYPTTHGVALQTDRLPSTATTIAEVFRAAGYATLSLSSVPFTGQYTNLHQGFEELHEASSLPAQGTALSAKTAREYVDRTAEWIERHREVPFFVYLHVFDPHHPYEPYAPYNTKWSDPARMEAHRRNVSAVTKVIDDPFMRGRGLPTREEVVKAGFDPSTYVQQELDWYDGSIRAMDAEMGRLFELLRRIGLDDETLIVLTSDHGTEFHEHGRFWHGQSVYGELTNVPLMIRWPSRVAAGRAIDDLVQSIDIVPTMLDLAGLPLPAGLQGQSLWPFLDSSAQGGPAGSWPGWTPRPAISERVPTTAVVRDDQKRQSVSIIDGNWKLIHNTVQSPGLAEFELFDYYKDPLNRNDVAAQHPDVVARLSKAIAGWRQMAVAARIKPDAETTKTLTAEELQRLRSLGYVR